MRDFAKFLYTHNPFYLLSVASVLFGLRTAFDGDGSATTTNAWMLAGSLGGYALLLAATAIFIVRVGKVWDDARTIALLVVLMVIAISSSFDRLCLDEPNAAIALFAASAAFAIMVIEALIRGLRLAFPWSSRLPLYLLVTLFFVFPPAANSSIWESIGVSLPWRVLCFPICAAILSLTLLPSIWRGSQRFQNNGSPWAWPWYPWSVFFFVALAVCGRSYLLTLAFQMGSGLESTFGAYYLVPLGFAVLILLSEIAFVEKSKALQELIPVGLFGLMFLAIIPGNGRMFSDFHFEVTHALGSPIWLTALGCLLFSFYFCFRHVNQRATLIQAVLVVMIFISPTDTRMPSLFPQNGWPLAVVSAIQFTILFKDHTSTRFLKAWIAAVGACSIWGQGGDFTRHFGIVPWHLTLVGAILAGLFFTDELARWLRKRLPVLMFGLSAAVAATTVPRGDLRLFAIVYVSSTITITVFFWFWHRMKLWKWACIGCFCLLFALLIGPKGAISNLQSRSAQALLVGAVCFVLGGAISAAKAGLASGASSRVRREWEQLLAEWNAT